MRACVILHVCVCVCVCLGPQVLQDTEGGLGTSEALEKEYLRLTSLPRASDVRPPHVLEAALAMVKAKWVRVTTLTHAYTVHCGQGVCLNAALVSFGAAAW